MEYLLPLIERETVAQDTVKFAFDITGQNFIFKAGQHADFTLINPPYSDEAGNTRIFSFTTSPTTTDRLEITTRIRGSAFKKSLLEIPLGTRVQVSNIRGRMTLHSDSSKPAVFLIGGIGITPFLSMLRWATATQLPHALTVFYANRTIASSAYLDELVALSKQNPHLTIIPTFTDETVSNQSTEHGPITLTMIKKYVPEFDTAIFYTAGPLAMVNAMLELLETANVAEERIKSEDFSGYEQGELLHETRTVNAV